MTKIFFDKLYRYPRKQEHAFVAIPVKQGELTDIDAVAVLQEGKPVPLQKKITARYHDGSVKYMFLRFMADLPGNRKTELICDYHSEVKSDYTGMKVRKTADGIAVDGGAISFQVTNQSDGIFEQLSSCGQTFLKTQFAGPCLVDGEGTAYTMQLGDWSVVENGPLVSILAVRGSNVPVTGDAQRHVDCEIRLTAYAEKPWVDISYRIINTTYEPLQLASLVFYMLPGGGGMNSSLKDMDFGNQTDSTGCGDGVVDNSKNHGPFFVTRGVGELDSICEKAAVEQIRTCVGYSNYKTEFYIGMDGMEVNRKITGQSLVQEANEHFAEVFYGTFFADRTDSRGGVCATIYQAQQNYPKAVKADCNGIAVMLVPEHTGEVIMQPGMAREQRFMLYFHPAEEKLAEIDNRSLIYQMPDRPYILPEVYQEAGVFTDIFPDRLNDVFEAAMIDKADAHIRSYGMLNWGDSPDMGYTTQGRGHGDLVWSNNEYDFPHACAMQYARTGVRRFLDYNFVTASHWMDVDICHFSADPLRIGGQWEHTSGHCKQGVMVCSHEWVEGLLDYYHLSGDERGLEAAIGIGENVRRLLETPMYAVPGEANARETGWALRSLTALYIETGDQKWLGKCQWIVDSFKLWEKEYGNWLAPYTDNTSIRVGFMIGVAAGSLMRYYREFPSEDIKEMLLGAVDDVVENCILPNGLFYYKELPSLQRNGNNTILLELLVIGYELTGDIRYLSYGLRTYATNIKGVVSSVGGAKKIVGDAVIGSGSSPKNFAQSFLPLTTYYKAVSDNFEAMLEAGYIKSGKGYEEIFL